MSTSLRKHFPFPEFEPRWQRVWRDTEAFRALNPGDEGFDPGKPKYFVLDMFPYPSGSGLHVGHPLGYIATDILARTKRMRGFNVLHPMGWDAFGLPAEQYAIKTGQHPAITTAENVARFRKQLEILGLGYDWTREVNTTDPGYFKWTQWIFLQLYGSWLNPATNTAEPIETYTGDDPDSVRLAYVSDAPVNWCPELGTVLANEEVIDGKSEVGGHPVERRPMRQWMLRITKYAQRLIEELDTVNWPEGIKMLQRNWIGRSEGAVVTFRILDVECWIEVFTTRPDTLFGATYMVMAPEHPLVEKIVTEDEWPDVRAYREKTARKSDLERTELAKEKTGVFTGAYAVNPVNDERIPVWIADYVLTGYGTGAIMAVPAHDERDWEFAQKFGLPVREVVSDRGIGFQPMRDYEAVEIKSGANLPHWTQANGVYAVTFRLADSLPQSALRELEAGRDLFRAKAERGEELCATDLEESRRVFSTEVDAALDAGHGSCALKDPKVAEIVRDALKHFHGERYELVAWCIMPNHVHAILRTRSGHALSDILHIWKSFTANAANKLLGRSGDFWQAESYDHLIRDRADLEAQRAYVVRNPAAAGLDDWAWVEDLLTHGQDAHATTCFTGEGVAVNSGFLDGLPTAEAKARMTAWLEERSVGQGTINYKLRDWLFSRQRYWGEPFPIVWEDGRHRAIPESELPLRPPAMDDFKPTGTPEPPLSKAADWVRYSEKARRETNTMPQWAGSCWYYLRYCDARNDNRFVGEEAERYWMLPHPESRIQNPKSAASGGVDLYVGGTEHAVLHLLYARFWHKVLFDRGFLSTHEPFQRLVNQGMMLGEDGQKMSKSRGNVVNPDDVVAEYGADSLRCYEMFMGPLEQSKPWSMKGVEGVHRFLARVWRLAMEEIQEGGWVVSTDLTDAPPASAQLRVLHATIKKVTADIDEFAFNTAISQLMVCTNEFVNASPRPVAALRILLPLLSPFAPHIADELWGQLAGRFAGFPGRASTQAWPVHDENFLVLDEVEYVVQVNGKLRDRVIVSTTASTPDVEAAARASAKVHEALGGLTVVKVIVVPKKLVNIVAK